MNTNNEPFRAYHRYSKAWYAIPTRKTAIGFGLYYSDGSTNGEMIVEWEYLNNNAVPRLECFDDGWSALATFTDLIQKMAKVNGKNISEEAFAKLLDGCGFKDLTSYYKVG